MPINNITQTISALPPAGSRGVDVQTQFVIKQEDFQDHLQGTTVTELNTLKDQLNSRIGEINSTTTTMNGYANTASAGASTATTKAGEASTSASAALTSKNQAGTFATNSSNSATKASQWADNNYNVAVETGKYSAKHWSTVAQNATEDKVDKVASTDNAIVVFDGTNGEVQNSRWTIPGNQILTKKASPSETIGIDLLCASGYSPGLRFGEYVDDINTITSYMRASSVSGLEIGSGWATPQLKVSTTGSVLAVSPTGGIGYGTGAGGVVTQLTSKSTSVTLNKPTGLIFTNNAALAAGASVSFPFYNSLRVDNDLLLVMVGSSGGKYSIDVGDSVSSSTQIRITNISTDSHSYVVPIYFAVIKGANS